MNNEIILKLIVDSEESTAIIYNKSVEEIEEVLQYFNPLMDDISTMFEDEEIEFKPLEQNINNIDCDLVMEF